jgi:restriction endonuclease S subunit
MRPKNNLVDAENHLPRVLDAFNKEGDNKNARWKDISDLPDYRRQDPQYHCRELNLGSTDFKKLKNVTEGNKLLAGYAYSSEYFGQGNRPLVKGKHLNNSLLNKDDLETISEDYYQNNKKIELEQGDILLAMDGGTNGFDASYIDSQVTDIAVNQRVSVIRVDESKIPPAYVFFVIISELGQKQLMKSKTQTATVAHLSNSQIEELKIPILDEEKIEEIAINFENYVSSVRETEEVFEDLSETVSPIE